MVRDDVMDGLQFNKLLQVDNDIIHCSDGLEFHITSVVSHANICSPFGLCRDYYINRYLP